MQNYFTLKWVMIYSLAVLVTLASFNFKIPLPKDRLTLKTVTFSPRTASHPDLLKSMKWSPVSLPHHWNDTAKRPYSGKEAWYRLTLDIPPDQYQLLGLLIPSVSMNAAVFFNGINIGNGGQFEEPVTRHWVEPLLINIPNKLISAGDNEILIKVRAAHAGDGSLSNVIIAPQTVLTHLQRKISFIRVGIVQMITAVLVTMGLLAGLIWSIRHKESIYGYFGLAALIWAIHNLNVLVQDIPFSTRLWEWMAYATIGFFVLTMMFYVHRILGKKYDRREKFISIILILASVFLLLLPEHIFYDVSEKLWYPAIFLLGFYIQALLTYEGWKQKRNEIQSLATCGWVILIYSAHDILVFFGVAGKEKGLYLHYAAPMLLSVFGFMLIRRFVASVAETESLNKELEQRVEQKRHQLELNYQRLLKLENQKSLADERDRITRDMHDGMGGTLVSTLAMLESGQTNPVVIEDAIRLALNDLRLMIDSLDAAGDDLPTMLGMFRARVGPLLKNAGCQFEWQVNSVPPPAGFGPEKALQIMRILQEAVTNTIKHANADTITLSTNLYRKAGTPSQEYIQLIISDNGNGLNDTVDPAMQTNGYGMKNMHHRANAIGATLTISSTAQGTRIQILLPINLTEARPA